MLTSKRMNLQPILESADGIHLTTYLVNRGKLIDFKAQLRKAIFQAEEWLNPIMSLDEKNKFLEPLKALLHDSRIFKQMKGNIGIFRNHDIFRVVNIPVEVELSCQVATSFHVKPLLKWLQVDQDFLILGLEEDAAHLFHGSQDSIKLIDSIIFPEVIKSKNQSSDYQSFKDWREAKQRRANTFSWLNEWIDQITKKTKPKLFIAGEKILISSFKRNLSYENTIKSPISYIFNPNDISEICEKIRKILKAESKDSIEKTLMEFQFAEQGNRVRKNIFQISKAVIQGKVKKLIVSDEVQIFGKIDKKSGGLAIHPFDLDHEDDDILDDLAQMVLSQGGDVIVASLSEIPNGRPILAILADDDKEVPKLNTTHHYEEIHESFG